MLTRMIRASRSRCFAAVSAAALLVGASAAQASQNLAIYTKNGVELICNIGDHDSFTGFVPPVLPGPFNGTAAGAKLAIVGTFDPLATVFVTDLFFDAGVKNILYSGGSDPNALTDAQINTAFDALYSGSGGGLLEVHSALTGCVELSPSDSSSFFNKFGPNGTGGGNLPSTEITVRQHGRITPVPVFGANSDTFGASGGLPAQFNVAFPVKVTEDGAINNFTLADLPLATQYFAVFTKGAVSLAVNLGDHDALAAGPGVDISGDLGPLGGTLDGTEVAIMGVFDEEAGRNAVMLSAPGGAAPLQAAEISGAFAAMDYMLNGIPSLPGVGATADLGAGFAAGFGCNAAGSLPVSICAPVGPGGLTIDVGGHATTPLENGKIQEVTITAGGLITAVTDVVLF